MPELKTNNFLNFYKKHNISPVSQNLDNLALHFQKRIGLYRALGLTPLNFRGREVLEVAPGSGYNSIVTATFKMKNYDLMEPNPTGFNAMINLFDKYDNTKNNSIQFINQRLEDIIEKKAYDIVLCEGLIHGLSDQDPFIELLSTKVRSGGILVVTCADAISMLFETLRRYLARILVSQKEIANAKTNHNASEIVQYLSEAFNSHLTSLKGMSRPVDDWIWDNLLNPAAASIAASNEFSIEKCLNMLGGSFYFYGSCPTFMNNWDWYKALPGAPRNFNQPFLDSFISQRHNLLHYKEDASPCIGERGKHLYQCCKDFAFLVEEKEPLCPGNFTLESCKDELEPVVEILGIVRQCQLKKSADAISEFLHLFETKLPNSETVASMTEFRGAFGRGAQYISLVKK